MEEKSSKTPRISRSGLVLCPSCMTHFAVKAHALVESVCPFCNQTLASSMLESSPSQSLASRHMMRGKSAALLATLGVSMTLFACDLSSTHTPEPSAVEPAIENQREQGASKPPTMKEPSSGGVLVPLYGAPSVMRPEDENAKRKQAEEIAKLARMLQERAENAPDNKKKAKTNNSKPKRVSEGDKYFE